MVSNQGTPLSELGLPARYENPFRRAGIHTVEVLCTRNRKELRHLKGVGESCMKAVSEALTKKGLCLADDVLPDVVYCICPGRPRLKFLMGNRQGEILECPTCSRLLYRSKATFAQSWYRLEVSLPGGLKIEYRHCDTCGGDEPHLLKVDGSWLCLNCRVRESESA